MNMKKTFRLVFAFLLLTVLAQSAFADVRVPAIIGDNMVLQQGKKIRIWGWANPNEKVSVVFANQKANAIADASGHWQTLLEPVKAGGPFELTISASNTLTIKNILVGEVWICSGQSNMEWPLINTQNGADAVCPGKLSRDSTLHRSENNFEYTSR